MHDAEKMRRRLGVQLGKCSSNLTDKGPMKAIESEGCLSNMELFGAAGLSNMGLLGAPGLGFCCMMSWAIMSSLINRLWVQVSRDLLRMLMGLLGPY